MSDDLESFMPNLATDHGNGVLHLDHAYKGNRVILLHGFQKKTQKTPKQELEIAAQRKKRYLQRHGYL